MCGILGTVGSEEVVSQRLSAMRDAMTHRGPDDCDLWVSPNSRAGLAHRRLSILDLSNAGRQPMSDPGGELHLVFNGEIYNYLDLRRELASSFEFRTETDSEVILAAYRKWGENFVEKLQGMFAFGIYDQEKRRLFLARDRAGEKPLFYFHHDGRFAFASELKALWQDPGFPRRIDPEMLQFYLAFGYVPAPYCMAKGFHKLPAAHAMSLDLESGGLRVWRYWDLPSPEPVGVSREEDLEGELEELLADAVRRQLVADVPVGVLLSGGLDSSLVAALAARTGGPAVRTFTISFPGHGAFDEAPFARKVAAHIGSQHHELVAEPSSLDLLSLLARQFDEPMADSSMIPTYLVSKLIREHAKVAVGGDGGDELFGGYMHYSRFQSQDRLMRAVPRFLRRATGAAAGRVLPVGWRGRNYFQTLGADRALAMAHLNIHFDARTRARLLGGAPDLRPEEYKMALFEESRGLPGQLMAADFRSYLAEDILVKVDRASMLASLEVRAPFLDHRVIEFAFARVPNRLRATRSARKILLRRLAQRLLPADVDWKRKQGFSLPLRAWFQGAWGRFFEGVLLDTGSDLFDRKAVQQLFINQRRGCSNTERLFALTLFELWRREYGCTLA